MDIMQLFVLLQFAEDFFEFIIEVIKEIHEISGGEDDTNKKDDLSEY